MRSATPGLSRLSDRQLVQELLLGKSGFQPGIFELYVEEAKRRNFDAVSYTLGSSSLVEFLSSIDVSRNTPFDDVAAGTRRIFPGITSRLKQVTGLMISLIGGLFLLAFFFSPRRGLAWKAFHSNR